MRRYELIAPCHFGLEAVLKREITDLGYDVTKVEDGRVTFEGDEEAICRINIFSRTAERILIKIGSFHAETYEELFQGTKALPWEEFIPVDGKFWVAKAASVKSKLFSPSDIQSIMKKAMVEKLKETYHVKWLAEDGLIEAALMEANIAPGMNRHYTAEDWKHIVSGGLWSDALEEAREMVDLSVETDIQGYDIDDKMVAVSRANAALAGVEKLIHFQKRGVDQLSHSKKYGFIITNPPYGERIEDKSNLPAVYQTIGERYRALDSWSMYLITAYEQAQESMKIKAAKNRKIYNGMMKTYFYQFPGPKPPRQKDRE